MIRTIRRGTSALLLALISAYSTGLPSHHHDDAERGSSSTPVVVGSDHHAHGSTLIEQDERVTAGGPRLPVQAVSFDELFVETAVSMTLVVDDGLYASERAPPPGAPRAPPLHV